MKTTIHIPPGYLDSLVCDTIKRQPEPVESSLLNIARTWSNIDDECSTLRSMMEIGSTLVPKLLAYVLASFAERIQLRSGTKIVIGLDTYIDLIDLTPSTYADPNKLSSQFKLRLQDSIEFLYQDYTVKNLFSSATTETEIFLSRTSVDYAMKLCYHTDLDHLLHLMALPFLCSDPTTMSVRTSEFNRRCIELKDMDTINVRLSIPNSPVDLETGIYGKTLRQLKSHNICVMLKENSTYAS